MPIILSEKQKYGMAILNDPDKTRILFQGGSRSGKTFLIFEWMIQRAFQFPGCRQLIVRHHRVDAQNSIWEDTLPKYLKMFIPDSEYELMKSELKVQFSNGSQIALAGLDDSSRMQKILGTEYLTIFVNECTELKYEPIQILITRLAQRVLDKDKQFYGVNKMVLDCNPTVPTSWVYVWGVKFCDPATKPPKPLKNAANHATVHWTPYDNLANLPPGYIEQLDALPEEMRERMLLGKWVGGQGQIFKEFKESVHVISPFAIPRSWAKELAIDFGYDHPCGILWGAYDFVSDTIYIYREFKESGHTIDEIAKLIQNTMKTSKEFYDAAWADHDAADANFLRKQGIYTKPAKKSVLDGIMAVRQRLIVNPRTQKPKLYIFSTCVKLIDEMYSYAWHKSTSEISDKDSPIKLDDDLVDPLRYLVYGRDKSLGGFI